MFHFYRYFEELLYCLRLVFDENISWLKLSINVHYPDKDLLKNYYDPARQKIKSRLIESFNDRESCEIVRSTREITRSLCTREDQGNLFIFRIKRENSLGIE